MAQSTKDDVSAPIGVLVVFLAIAMGIGAGGGFGGGGNDGGGNRPAAEQPGPCPPDADPDQVVRSWTVDGKVFRLRCSGYRHIVEEKGRRFGGRAYDCIEKVLTRGKPGPPERGKVEYDYRHPKGRAKVIVVRATGDVINAYVRRSTWSDCAAS